MPDSFLHPGFIIPIGQADLPANDQQPRMAKGMLSFVRDDYGLKIFRYVRNMKAAAAATVQGGLYTRSATVSVTLGASSGSTTLQLKKVGAFAQDTYVGRVAVMRTNATVGGTAPENEAALIVASTPDLLQLDAARPLTAAPSVGADVIDIVSIHDFAVSAAADLAPNIFGVALVPLTSQYWGFLQGYGYNPIIACNAGAAIGAGVALTSDVERVVANAAGAGSSQHLVGFAISAVNATNSGKVPGMLDIVFGVNAAGVPG
jgi:hypothetical protein